MQGSFTKCFIEFDKLNEIFCILCKRMDILIIEMLIGRCCSGNGSRDVAPTYPCNTCCAPRAASTRTRIVPREIRQSICCVWEYIIRIYTVAVTYKFCNRWPGFCTGYNFVCNRYKKCIYSFFVCACVYAYNPVVSICLVYAWPGFGCGVFRFRS